MRKTVSSLMVIGTQFLIVGLFFTTVFNEEVKVEKHVSTVHNENLNKIANSVSILFLDGEAEDKITLVDDFTLEELPAAYVEEEIIDEEPVVETTEEETDEEAIESIPLYSIDASKYASNEAMGFKVTEDNKQYELTDDEFDVVVAVVAGEFDKNLNDALGVVSVILNRCDSEKWNKWAGDSPYDQVIRKGQFEVYFSGMYKNYMPGSKLLERDNYKKKYEIAKQAVIDGLNGIRNNEYLGFRANWITGYSDKYIVEGGNRYGYN